MLLCDAPLCGRDLSVYGPPGSSLDQELEEFIAHGVSLGWRLSGGDAFCPAHRKLASPFRTLASAGSSAVTGPNGSPAGASALEGKS